MLRHHPPIGSLSPDKTPPIGLSVPKKKSTHRFSFKRIGKCRQLMRICKEINRLANDILINHILDALFVKVDQIGCDSGTYHEATCMLSNLCLIYEDKKEKEYVSQYGYIYFF